MNRPPMRHLVAVLALAAVLAPPVQADPPADKGKGNSSSQGKGGKGADDRYDSYYDTGKDKDKEKNKDNHGRRVSECNQRANDRKLKGPERKDYVEWCVDRGERYRYDDRRFDSDRSCYRKADEKGLSGGFRQAFLVDCLDRQDRKR